MIPEARLQEIERDIHLVVTNYFSGLPEDLEAATPAYHRLDALFFDDNNVPLHPLSAVFTTPHEYERGERRNQECRRCGRGLSASIHIPRAALTEESEPSRERPQSDDGNPIDVGVDGAN